MVTDTERFIMERVDRLEVKLDKVIDGQNDINKNLALYTQKNDDTHVAFDKRICKLEESDATTVQVWREFMNSPLVAKVIIIVTALIVTGGAGISVAGFLGMI